MDFALNKQQQELHKAFQEFCMEKIAPGAAAVDASAAFPKSNWTALAEQGYMGLMLPEEFGGKAQDLVTGFACTESLATACGATAMAAGVSAWLCNTAILKYGTDDAKKALLPELAKGAKIGALALSEPGAGTDINATAATAEKQGDDWLLNGVKGLVWNGPVADVMITLARTGGDDKQPELTAFIVDCAADGVSKGEAADTMGFRGAVASNVELKGCKVPAANVLGEPGGGWAVAQDLLDYGRLHLAALSIGMSQTCFNEAKEYAEDRAAFGKPIGAHQEVAFMIADIHVQTDMARLLSHRAAWEKQQGMKSAVQMIACAKQLASEAVVGNADRAVQVLGGRGFLKGSAAERIYRSAKFAQLGQGTREIMHQVICKDLLGPDF